MSGFRSLVLILVGATVGWSAARFQGGVPSVSVGPTSASAENVEAALSGTCAIPVVKAVENSQNSTSASPSASTSTSPPTLLEQLSKLKISELHKNCEEAEIKFLDAKLAGYGKMIYELPPNEREQMMADWGRRFQDLIYNGSYYKAHFNLEFGGDVVQMDVIMDLQANSDDQYKCASTTVYFEINGKANSDSYFTQSQCDGSGARKKGDHFYFDINFYPYPGVGKYITILLLPMPGGGGAEYLGGEAEKWVPISQFSWQKVSIIEVSQLQQRFQQKVEQLGGP